MGIHSFEELSTGFPQGCPQDGRFLREAHGYPQTAAHRMCKKKLSPVGRRLGGGRKKLSTGRGYPQPLGEGEVSHACGQRLVHRGSRQWPREVSVSPLTYCGGASPRDAGRRRASASVAGAGRTGFPHVMGRGRRPVRFDHGRRRPYLLCAYADDRLRPCPHGSAAMAHAPRDPAYPGGLS